MSPAHHNLNNQQHVLAKDVGDFFGGILFQLLVV
jgi:hypothetical protein